MASIEASIEYSNVLSPVSADGKVSGAYDFTNVTEFASYYNVEKEWNITVDLSDPIYIYERQVVIEYANGKSELISCGMRNSSVPQPLNERVEVCH
jgi:hypothetical protein